MNSITRRIWERGIYLKKWCDINSFNYRYTVLVMNGKRGAWDVGVVRKIKNALINQLFAKETDFDKESGK
jgi:hypothetical protein